MKRYIVAPEAEQDLDDIKAYLTEEGGARVARSVLKQIKDAVDFLSQTPGVGHSREDLTSAAVKFWSVYSYLIIKTYQETSAFRRGGMVSLPASVRIPLCQRGLRPPQECLQPFRKYR